jgi:hypothetical protein
VNTFELTLEPLYDMKYLNGIRGREFFSRGGEIDGHLGAY